MVPDNIVVFKGKKDGIVIVLDDKAEFEDLKAALRVKVADARKFFGGAKISIVFQGRELNESEEAELLEIVIQEANLNVSFVKEQESNPRPRPRAAEPAAAVKPSFDPFEHMMTIHKGALRAGKSIRYAGSVMVLGDVNPGAEIIAEGNVVILGALKGMVHAGCMGNTACFVAALNMTPVQMRIADRATYIPQEMIKKNKKKPIPSYAYVHDGQIYIAPM